LAQAPAGKPGSVEGVVRNSTTGGPVRKATVTLYDLAQGHAFVALSDAEGRFRMPAVEPAAKFQIIAECPGFTFEPPRAANFSLAEGQAVTGIDVKLIPLGAISGRVLDEDGEALPGVEVVALLLTYQGGRKHAVPLRSATTDDRGAYRMFDLPVGRYYVLARPAAPESEVRQHSDQPEQSYPSALFPGVSDLAAAGIVEMVPGAEASGLDFHLHRAPVYHIRGRAIDQPSGQPFQGRMLRLRLCSAGLDDLLVTGVDLPFSGAFDIPVPPGRYCLAIEQGGFASQPVTVADEDLSNVLVSVSPMTSISGTLTYEGPAPRPTEPAYVTLACAGGFPFQPASSVLPNNSFLMRTVPPVACQIDSLRLPGYYVKSIEYGERDAPDGRFQVTAGGTLKLVAASDTHPLAVKVQRADGSPAAGVAVTIAPTNGRHDWLRNTTTDANGVAGVPGMPPGDYQVFAWEKIEEGLATVPEFRKLLEARAASVTITASAGAIVQTKLIPADAIDEAEKKLP
jgi:hypothetical protein